MTYHLRLIVFFLIAAPVWAALECTDWEGRSVTDGSDFNPKKEDPCYVCRCDNGQSTMCKSVSCGAPNCKYWQQIPGKCCQFECLDAEIPGSEMNGRENYTGTPPTGPKSGNVNDATMTDLGLRLAASTVTTFLILALLLFLLHRLRQKRLRMALRRYSRRRHDLDDSDNTSYPPDFIGLQYPPPYEDPPPPYSPPKPQRHHARDQPPPYDAIDEVNTEIGQMDSNGNQIGNRNEVQSGITGSGGNHRNSGQGQRQNQTVANGSNFTFSAVYDFIDPRNLTGRYTNRNSSQFCSDITNVITSDSIQNQPYSLIQSRTVQKSETEHELNQNERVLYCHQVASDIGESTSSSESDESCHSNSVPTEYENRAQEISANEERQLDTNIDSGVILSPDAETTVKQFLDKQFGQIAKNQSRHYPTSMSQSWTCSELFTNAPHLGLAGSFSRNSGCFQPNLKSLSTLVRNNESETLQDGVPRTGIRCGKCNNILACKCNKMKTNGLLTRSHSDYTQNVANRAPKEAVTVSRNNNLRLLPGSFGARVSYVEPEDVNSDIISKTDNHDDNPSQYHSDSETNISYFTPNTQTNSPNVSHCYERESPIISKRDDVLRELRLSHLLFSPVRNSDSSPPTSSLVHKTSVMSQRPKVIHSPTSAFSLCSEQRGRQNIRPFSEVISNDAKYPSTPFDVVQTPACTISGLNPKSSKQNGINLKSNTPEVQKSDLNYSTNTLQSLDRLTVLSEEDNTRQCVRENSKQLPKEKQRNTDFLKGPAQDFHNAVPMETNFGEMTHNYFKSNVNTDKSAIKLCSDKDVSKFITSGLPSHLNFRFDSVGSVSVGVPTVRDRANASQFYNFEQDEQIQRKNKKKCSHKRHLESNFPEGSLTSPRKPENLRSRQKCSSLRSKHLRKLDLSDNEGNSDDKTDLVLSRQFYQTLDTSAVKCLPITSLTATKQNPLLKPIQPSVDNLAHKDNSRISMMMPTHHDSFCASNGAKSLTKSSCHNDTKSQNIHGRKSQKRSRSLGKDEHHVGVHAGNQPVETYPSQKSVSRRRRNRQSFPGTNAFHRELEHVLESQKKAMSFSVGKSFGKKRTVDGQPHAVTQV